MYRRSNNGFLLCSRLKLYNLGFKESGVVTINTENFRHEVEESKLSVVVDVYATWCPL